MAIMDVKENVRLKLELDGGMDGDKQIIKSKTYSKIKPTVENEALYEVAESLADLQTYPIYKVKRLEEIHLVRE
ncbi:uncharacterized protein DUF1659 [Keratinibaculum paraultunense]|uniref:Uncharacterized protein DUF1659 n=2 Tax=Keratinibaculum paraultunense TaxID=1278232 RepID=A0A4R3KTE8_9FIRM|nr:DUF1659 domain-containing protein [Keratinibaculum paraultunense]TCS88538.1 uncharacterized protein DUF1659 [Keratinibaculum paraultunense]